MFYGLSNLDVALWSAIVLLQAVLIAFLPRHRKHHPLFLAYVLLMTAHSLILAVVYRFGSPEAYFYTYYLCQGAVALGFCLVLMEIARAVFAPYNTIPLDSVITLLGASCLAVIFALTVAALSGVGFSGGFWSRLITLERFTYALTVMGLWAVFYVANELNLPWDRQSKAVALGLGFYCLIQGVASCFALYGVQAQYTRPIGFLGSVVTYAVWIAEFRNPPPALQPLTRQGARELLDFIRSLSERLDSRVGVIK